MRAKIPPITRSKSPMLAGNKENEGKRSNGGSLDSLSISATQRRARAATPSSSVGNGRGRRPLNDLLSTSNSNPNPNPRRGRGRGVEQHPSSPSLRKCSPSPTPITGTPRSASCGRISKLEKSEEFQRSRGSVKYGVKDRALSQTIFQSGKTPSQIGNGMKKNCGLQTGNLPRSRSGSLGLASRKRHDAHKEDHDSLRGRSQETGLRLPMVGSPKPKSAAALQRVEATPLQKVYLNNCHATPAQKLLEKVYDYHYATPATRVKGRYQDTIPTHVLVGREDAVFTTPTIGNECDFTPAHTTLRKGGDFTPASNPDGKGGDFTPVPASNWNRGDFTPAQHNIHATPEQRTQVTPPVQPSISPEIHSQNFDELQDGHRCFGAGHVMAPVIGKVRDRRKCRPRGILTVGEATPILLDKNRRFSLDPVPTAASVKWMSPKDAKNLTNLPDPQATPSSGFTQGSSSISSKYLTSQVSSSPGFTQATPSSVSNSKSPNPQATSLSGIVANSKSVSPQVTSPLYGLTPAAPRSRFCSKLPNHESTISSRFTPATQDLSTVLPTVFPQEVPYIGGIFSPVLTTGTGNLEGTPLGISSKFQNCLCTTPSGLTPEIQNGQGISASNYNQEISNLEATSSCGFSPQVLSCSKSNSDISPQCRFHPYFQCGDSQGATLSISSQSGFKPNTFPQDSDSHRTCLSSANVVLPYQCTGSSEVARPTNLKASMDKDNLRQEIQMPIPSSKGFSQVRISWRDGLMGRIFKLSELDSCDLTLEGTGMEEHKIVSDSKENYLFNPENNTNLEYSCPFSNDLQLDAPFGSFEYMTEANADMSDPSMLLASSPSQENVLSESLVRSFISPASQGVEAESIYAENITSSGDLDWTFCYKNQLFEEAT